MKKSKIKSAYYDEENYYWKQLFQELEKYKQELESSNVELSEGLAVSRQKLVEFMQDFTKGLPVKRSNLLQLWDYLTSIERCKNKKISERAKLNRANLRKKGADELLEKAGFLPSYKNQGIFESEHYYKNTDLSKTIKEWDQRNPHIVTNPSQLNKLQKELARLSSLGQRKFSDQELNYLYQSILENEDFDKNIYITHDSLKLRIIDCQFKTLTVAIEEYISIDLDKNQNIKKKFFMIRQNLEKELRGEDSEQDDNFEYSPVITVMIECQFKGENKKISWFHSSVSTHYQNMFAAIENGLGYTSSLTRTNFYIKNLGAEKHSLVKTYVELFEEISQQKYSGQWVGNNTILSILQSTANAAISWSSQYLKDQKNCLRYIRRCQDIAKIERQIIDYRKYLNGYIFREVDYSFSKSPINNLELNIINKIEKLKNECEIENTKIYFYYKVNLERLYCLANLMGARLANVSGKLSKAKEFLTKSQESLKQIEDHIPTYIMYEVENKVYQFFSGDEIFLSTFETWQKQQESWLSQLNTYINTENPKYGHYPGNLGINIYCCASEIFGRIGRLSLCFGNDKSIVNQAVDNLLKAAYCSAKIGYLKRVVHWLANASRAYCRLGEKSRAESLCKLAENILSSNELIDKACSDEYKKSIKAEINIAYGEVYLLIDKNYVKAVKFFLNSLKGSIYLGFARLISENFYNIARASKHLDEPIEILFINDNTYWDNDNDNDVSQEAINFLKELNMNQTWKSLHDNFQEEAKKIWHNWYLQAHPNNGQGKHPIEDDIDTERFMCRLD
jgi:hypothetical protein